MVSEEVALNQGKKDINNWQGIQINKGEALGLTAKYFTNASNFKKIAEVIRTDDELPDKIDKHYLKKIGYTDPADELILNFFKELQLLADDNTSTPLLEKFRESSTSKEAMAIGILKAYEDLFEADPAIYQQPKEEIIQLLESLLGDEKSHIIINYMVNTFKELVDYVGHETLGAVLGKKEFGLDYWLEQQADNQSDTEVIEGVAEHEGPVDDEGASGKIDPLLSDKSDKQSGNSRLAVASTSVTKNGNGIPNGIPKAGPAGLDVELSLASEVEIIKGESSIDYINKAYIKKAELLHKLERFEEALPAFDQVYRRFANASEDGLYKTASIALVKKMEMAEKLDLRDYLIPIYSAIIDRLAETKDCELATFVDHAYINVTEILLENNQVDEALEMIDQAINRFRETKKNPDFLAKTMYSKAEIFEQSGNDKKALEAFDNILKEFE